jgi:hypothetical protein
MNKDKELERDYSPKSFKMIKEYQTLPIEKKIEILLAHHSVSNLRLDSLEKMRDSKMSELRKKVLEDSCNSLQQKIWICESQISNLFGEVSINNPRKNKIEIKIKDANIFDWSYGVPDIQTNMTTKEFNSLLPQDKIEILFIERKLLYIQYQAIGKNRQKLFKTPNFKEYEKILSTYHLSQLKREIFSLYKKICWLYFAELPKDYPFRKELRRRILGKRVAFDSLIITPMLLYEDEDDPSISGNLQDIVMFDGDLQIIIDVLKKYTLTQIFREIDLLEIIKEKSPSIKKKLERIPKDVLDQRKEILEEVLKAKIRDFRKEYY